ncbi:MAG: BamA/TamA family outer membrane protein [Planctomycetes bacterium]|nr:BamA/TamA family outer membrane protein [Planctomycetota bacterium]
MGIAIVLLGACAAGTTSDQDRQDVELIFEGAEEIGHSELAEVIERDVERYREDPRPSVLDDAVFRLLQHYRSRGFVWAAVEARASGRRLTFTIREGPGAELGRVRFEGNQALSRDDLEEVVERVRSGTDPAYSPKLLSRVVEALLAAYGEKGYVEAVVSDPQTSYVEDQRAMNVTFRITEGKSYTLRSIEGLPEQPEVRKRLGARIGATYTPHTGREVEAAIVDYYRERGHPFVRVRVETRLDRDQGLATLLLDMRLGPFGVVGEIQVVGNQRARESFVRSRSGLEPGIEYRLSDLVRAQKRIMDTGLFRQVTVTPVGFQEGSKEFPIEIRVEEVPPGEVSLRGGFGSLEGPRVGADVAYHDLFGGAEYVRLGGTFGSLGSRADIETGFPYILGTEFRPSVSVYFEEQKLPSFDATSFGAVPSVLYPLTEHLKWTVGARAAFIRTSNVEPDVPPGDRLDFDYLAVFTSAEWDWRNNATLPSRGFRLHGLVETSRRALASDVQFIKGSGGGDGYVPLPWDLVLAASLDAGMIRPIERTEEIPISIRYFAGGTTTVRGFEYGTLGPKVDGEPTGGEVFASLQVELRFPIWGELHGALFTDRGGVWADRRDVDLDETRYSVGLGLRYYTPAGALVADVAWNVARKEDEDPVEFHVSVGFPF